MKYSIMKMLITGLFCSLLSIPAMAQEDELKDLPGYVDFGDLSSLYGEAKIIINLGGTMLNFVSMMSSEGNPETADLISKLKGVRVQIFDIEETTDASKAQFSEVRGKLNSSGWEPIVQVNDEEEQVLIFMKMNGQNMEGMTVMVVDNEEAVFINVIGQLNPTELGKVMDVLDVDVDMGMD